MKSIIMSIHHVYAELIYQGKKTVELRKTSPFKGSKDPTRIFLYDTSCKMVTGTMYVDGADEIGEITPELCRKSFLFHEEILKYKAKGKGKLYAWNITKADRNTNFLPLSLFNVKRAPQSYQFYKEQTIKTDI